MKREIVFLVLFLPVQICCKVTPVLAQGIEATFANQIQQDENSMVIKKVIETLIQSLANRDLDSMMNQISKNYSTKSGKGIIDYERFKKDFEKWLNKTVDISISDLKILELNVSDNKATVLIEYNFKGYDLDGLKEINEVQKRKYVLIKEVDTWKIISRIK